MITKKEQKIIDKIQSNLSSCVNCESWDSGEPLWIWGDETDVFELLMDYEINEDRKEIIACELICPNCKSELELMSRVGTKRKYQLDFEKYLKDINKKYSKNLEIFDNFIRDYPLLALKNPIGKKIFKEITENKLPIISINQNSKFYRGRLSANSNILNSDDFLNAPIGKSSEGRFNHNGQSHLYLCDVKEGAMLEVVSEGLVWIQEFKFNKIVNNILNLKFESNEISISTNALLISLHFSNALTKYDNNTENWKPDYFITRFIMDCARNNGYNGIIYNSIKHFNASNLVLFYPNEIDIKTVGNPEILKQKSQNFSKREFNF